MTIVRAVLLDLDGTLIDSTPAVARSWARWGEQWGVGDVFASHEHGRPAREIVAGHLPADQVDAGFSAIEAMEIADTDGIVVLPGARELLDALPRNAWAIVTSCSRPLAVARLAAVGLEPPVLVTASDTSVGKPAPDPFLEAARRLGVDPADCLVVEDAPAGLTAGRAAGATTLAVEGTVDASLLDADLTAPSLTAVAVEVLPDGIQVTLLPS
jgi:sugar-phosphatase